MRCAFGARGLSMKDTNYYKKEVVEPRKTCFLPAKILYKYTQVLWKEYQISEIIR